MNQNSLVFLIVLLLPIGTYSQIFDVVKILDNGDPDKRINFVYLGDGYTETQQDLFINDSQNALYEQLNTSPYKEYRNFFNAYAIKVLSNESGVDHPTILGNSECSHIPKTTKDTYFNATFDYAGIHRLLVPKEITKIYNVLADNIPFYDQVNIIVNTPYYGGSGGIFATASTHDSSNQIMIHEIGHSFVDLSDEYWVGLSFANESANMTQESDISKVKWKNWLNNENINIYPYGSTSPENTWFRPHQNCKMRYLDEPFCAVCREATIDRIYALQPPINSFLPKTNTVVYKDINLDFSIDLILPNPNTLHVKWFLDGDLYASDTTNITLTNSEIINNIHTVNVIVEDLTDLSRTYLFANGYIFNITWIITNNSASISENTIKKFIYKVFPNPTQEQLFFSYTANNISEYFEIIITDLLGKDIYNNKFQPLNGTHQFPIDIVNFSSGIYVLNIKTKTYNKSFKFLKE
jgi:hypothetical protein